MPNCNTLSSKGSFAFGILLVTMTVVAQQRYESGPHQGFVKEDPELNKIEIAAPFQVSAIRGCVVYGASKPLSRAWFEIRDRSGQVQSAITDDKGGFEIPGAAQGSYSFKVTLDGFHSVTGTLVLSRKFPRKRAIQIQLQLGT
jgi:hypothetical protein